MNDPSFLRAIEAKSLADPGRVVVEIADQLVAIFHVGGAFYALDDVCTHDGGPLAEGPLDGFTVACPRHGAKFDIRDGKALCMPATKPTHSYPVEVRDGWVCVKVD